MKTYLLRQPRAVEPQNSQRAPVAPLSWPEPSPVPGPVRPATTGQVLGQPIPPTPRGPALFIGLDVHSESIAVSLAPSDSTEVRRYSLLGGTHDEVFKLARKLTAAHPGATLRFCYEAGPHGFALYRCLRSHGYDCLVVAPSKIPRLPGDRVKTDRRDADQLARLHRAGELTPIHVPEPQDEAVRDLLRARYQVQRQLHSR